MCSSRDGAVDDVISAIDRLAADSRAGLTGADMRARIAAVWAMLAALDPELARLTAGYGHAQPRSTRRSARTDTQAHGPLPPAPSAAREPGEPGAHGTGDQPPRPGPHEETAREE